MAKNEGEKPDPADMSLEELGMSSSAALDTEPQAKSDDVPDEAAEDLEESAGEEEEEEEKEAKPSYFSQVSPYTVLLFIALVAMIVASLCLYAAWMRYGGDTKAKSWKQGVAISQPFYPAPASKTATA